MAASALPVAPQASADVADVREGFRRRGMGFSAVVNNAGTGANNTVVTEAFDFPNVQVVNPFSVSDAAGDNDGYPEPGENVTLTVSVTNTTGATITNVVVSVAGGGSANVGTMTDGQTTPVQLSYTVPANAVCGSFHQVMITASSDAGMQAPKTYEFRLGAPVGGLPATFTNSTAIVLPGVAGQTSGPAAPYPTTITTSGLSGTKLIKVSLNSITHTFPADLDFLLEGPGGQKYIFVSDSGGGGDVSALNISFSDGAAAQPSTTQWVAGDFRPYNTGANDPFVAPAPAGPYTNAAPAAADTFTSVFGTNGSTMNGDWKLWTVDDAGGDSGSITGGWSITFEADDYTCSLTPGSPRGDFDGDGKTDLAVFQPLEGNWYIQRSTAGFTALNWGLSGDKLVPGDYDGDGKADTAIFRPNNNKVNTDFYILNSNGFTLTGFSWGLVGDIPVVSDYDNDNKADAAIYRPSEGNWYIRRSTNGGATIFNWGGQIGDVPVVGDFNGGGADYTIRRGTTWMTSFSGGGTQNVDFGTATDLLVPANYDGDTKDDIAVFRPSTGVWYIIRSSDSVIITVPWGLSGDIPVPGDYDGDGKDDQAVYRGGIWYLNQSTSGSLGVAFGLGSDNPIPKAYIP